MEEGRKGKGKEERAWDCLDGHVVEKENIKENEKRKEMEKRKVEMERSG